MEVRVERSAKDVITPEKIQKPAPPVLSSADTAFLKSFGVNKLQKVFKPVFSAEEKTQVMYEDQLNGFQMTQILEIYIGMT